MKLKALIVDDEKEVANALRLLLSHTCPDVEIVGICHTIVDAIKTCKNKLPDILFLDIEMPGGSGFDVLEVIGKDHEARVIFTTAHSEYAIRAIKSGAKDYLLKPIDPDELILAVEKVREEKSSEAKPRVVQRNSSSIPVTTSKGILLLNKEDIIFIKAEGRYSQLYCRDEKSYTVCKNIGEYEEELSSDFFFRVHKSYIINCKHVVKINSSDGGFVEMSNKKEIEISKRKKGEFIQFLK
jgi:two-component system, LytTR family, response regulator